MAKIIFFQHYGHLSGSLIGLANTVSMFRDLGYIVKVYLSDSSDCGMSLFKDKEISTEMLPLWFFRVNFFSGGPSILSRTFCSPFFHIRNSITLIEHIIVKEQPDIVFSNSLVLSWMSILKKNHSNVMFICHVRESLPKKSFIMKYVYRRLLQGFDYTFFISEYDVRRFAIKTKHSVVRDCISAEDERIVNSIIKTKNKCMTIGFVGGDNPIKGLKQLLKGVIKINTSHPIIVKIGGAINNSGNFDDYFSAVNSQKIEIVRVGQYSNVFSFLQDVDILICPSTKPHQLRPIFEAGFLNIPVITPSFCETRDSLQNEYNGLSYNHKSIKELSICMERLIDDKELVDFLGKNNGIRARKLHSYSAVYDCLKKIVHEVE